MGIRSGRDEPPFVDMMDEHMIYLTIEERYKKNNQIAEFKCPDSVATS